MKRRDFIRLSSFTAGAWLLSDSLPANLLAAGAPEGQSFSPDKLLKITDTGKVTIYVAKQEMGQNAITSLPLLIAEELELNPKDITVELLPFQAGSSGNYTTWGSGSIRGSWMQMRKVGATAKAMLLSAAAAKWNVPVDVCKADDGKIINTNTKAVLYYKDLVKEASALTPPTNAPLKNVKDFKVVGKTARKSNIKAIVTGQNKYTMDVKLPGMLYAAVVRCPFYKGKVASYDAAALATLSGFVKVVPVTRMDAAANRNGIAIIATNTWAALQGQRLLKVKWDYEVETVKDTEALKNKFKSEIETGTAARVTGKERNAPFKPITGSGVYEAVYEVPYVAHATMEPMNCTASFKDGKFEVWGGFQAPMYITNNLPKLFNIDKNAITVNLMPMGGSFGRKEQVDNVVDAMQLTQAMNAPVQVIYSRSDDMQADFYRHSSYHKMAAISGADNISTWRHQLGIATYPGKEITGHWHTLGGAGNDLCYATGDYQSAYYPVESPIPLGSWRSIGFMPNVFVIESFIDELAVHNRVDPVAFRMSLLKDNGSPADDNYRMKKVIAKCAEQIGWSKKPVPGRYRGIAACMYGHSSSLVAHAFEISVSKDKLVKVHRCVAAADFGLVIDPDGLKAQIEGSLVWALTGVFKNEITVADGQVQQKNFADYPVLRMNEMPPFEIVFIEGGDTPGGGGEPAVPSVGPALCNAIFAATGQRIRQLPIQKHGYRLV